VALIEETKAFEHVTGDHPFEDKNLFYHFVKRAEVDGGANDGTGIDSDLDLSLDSNYSDRGEPGLKSMMTGVPPKSSESLHSSRRLSTNKESMSSIGLETRSSDNTLAISESLTEIDIEASVFSRNSQARSKRGPSTATTKELVVLLKSNDEQKDRTYRLKTYRNCFIGERIVLCSVAQFIGVSYDHVNY
jgi:hypothetical protein